MHILWGVSGSFCNLETTLRLMEQQCQKHTLHVILSEHVWQMDTRFMSAATLKERLQMWSEKPLMHTLQEAELISLNNPYDVMVVCPCTANTLAKLVHGIYDNGLLLAIKTMLRNQRPVVLAFASNDGLGISSKNVMEALNMKHLYMVPMGQDDYRSKPNSLISVWSCVDDAIEAAGKQQQLQPIVLTYEKGDAV